MYRTVQGQTKSWTIHSNFEVKIPLFTECNEDSKTRTVFPKFNPTKTNIVSAELYVKAFSDWGDVRGKYFINDEVAAQLEWSLWEGGKWKEARVDVKTLIRYGAANTFKAQACKWTIIGAKPVPLDIFTIQTFWTSILTITWTGEDPGEVEPPLIDPEWWEKLEEYAPYIVLGAGAAAVLIIWTRSK